MWVGYYRQTNPSSLRNNQPDEVQNSRKELTGRFREGSMYGAYPKLRKRETGRSEHVIGWTWERTGIWSDRPTDRLCPKIFPDTVVKCMVSKGTGKKAYK